MPLRGALGDVGVGGEREQRGQALEVDREIGRGVELGHFPGLEMIEPGAHAGRADRGLLGAACGRSGRRSRRAGDGRRDRRRCGTAARGSRRSTTARRCRARPSSSGSRGSRASMRASRPAAMSAPKRARTQSSGTRMKSAQSWQSSIGGRMSAIIASVSAPARPVASRASAARCRARRWRRRFRAPRRCGRRAAGRASRAISTPRVREAAKPSASSVTGSGGSRREAFGAAEGDAAGGRFAGRGRRGGGGCSRPRSRCVTRRGSGQGEDEGDLAVG